MAKFEKVSTSKRNSERGRGPNMKLANTSSAPKMKSTSPIRRAVLWKGGRISRAHKPLVPVAHMPASRFRNLLPMMTPTIPSIPVRAWPPLSMIASFKGKCVPNNATFAVICMIARTMNKYPRVKQSSFPLFTLVGFETIKLESLS